jgi:hypothetical protein
MRSRLRSPAAGSRRARWQRIGEVYETFVRAAGTAKEKAARGNLLQILTAGDDVEHIGEAEAIDDCDP